MTALKDRLARLLDPANTVLNGVDFVEILHDDETTLRVHFHTTVAMAGTVTAATIDGGERIASVAILAIDDGADWEFDARGRPLLTLRVAAPGDFSFYRLTLQSVRLDRYFDHATFSFKALCPSDLDCESPAESCPPPEGDPPPIDYLAKDFLSFREALLDFSALRYPEWQERSEADFGVMFAEALSSLADDLSYTQDRIAAEATLDTATQRRSIIRHAHLVDHVPRPATAARVLLQMDITIGPLPGGLAVSALGPDGEAIVFETGDGLVDPATGGPNQVFYPASPAWNSGIVPYWWDEADSRLEPGTIGMWVTGHGFAFQPGVTHLLIDTAPAVDGDPPIRQVVLVTATLESVDALFLTNGLPTPVTWIAWDKTDALTACHDLTRTQLAGNIITATQGQRRSETFFTGGTPTQPNAAVRLGPNSTRATPVAEYRRTLSEAPVAWLSQPGLDALPLPEILLNERPPDPTDTPIPWLWRRTLLEASRFDPAFTLDALRMSRVARMADGAACSDIDGGPGDTLRFGDGVFGRPPEPGTQFDVTWRVGLGAAGNVAADSITRVDPASAAYITAVTNPLPATGGADPEPDESVRRLAPQAFRARQFRAVRASDYADAVERLDWVTHANASFRWTGSWLTVFASADPQGSETLSPNQHLDMIQLLNRYRLAGYEVYAPPPKYVTLDVQVAVCARADAFRGDVEAALGKALSTGVLASGAPAFFHPDRFTFGTPLERSQLEAAIQEVTGVAGVVSIKYRRRDVGPAFGDMPDTVTVAASEVLRCDNDRSLPERGALKLTIGGGK